MKFWWFGMGLSIVAILLQATFGQWIRLGPTTPDMLLVILVWLSLELRLIPALILGLVVAFFKIGTSGEPPLLISLSLFGVVGFSSWVGHRFIREALSVQLGVLGILCFIVYGMALFWIHPFDSFRSGIGFFFSHVLLTTLYTVAIAPWVWRWIDQLFTQCGWNSSTRSVS